MAEFNVFIPGGEDWKDDYRGEDAFYVILPGGALFAEGRSAGDTPRVTTYAPGCWLRVEGEPPLNLPEAVQ